MQSFWRRGWATIMNPLFKLGNTFDVLVEDYARHAVMQTEVGLRMLSRLQYYKIQPQYILDLGCGPGFGIHELQKHYPKAHIVGVDLSFNMLKHAQSKRHWWQPKIPLVQADTSHLPFADNSVDLIVANQLLPWLVEPKDFFLECMRVLKPQALLLFTTLGPDTYKEFSAVREKRSFLDMHDLGDMLQHMGFMDPVMDREDLILQYSNQTSLKTALQAQGERCLEWQYTEKDSNVCALTYELIYGQAWKGQKRLQAKVQTISLEKLKRTIPSQS
jgi:malonyl-CoA O-methyltransferase